MATFRHAVVRSTGATTWTHKDGDEWKCECLNHGTSTTAPTRAAAWTTGTRPQNWCATCKRIAAGKVERRTDGLLPLPATPTAKAKAGKVTKTASKVAPARKLRSAKKTASKVTSDK